MLYHVDKHWPKRVSKNLPFGERRLIYSQHAKRAAQNDRYGSFSLPNSVNMSEVFVFEAEFTNRIEKIVFRFPIDDKRDMVMACMPMKGYMLVKTVWINLSSDNHATLKTERYS